MSDIVSTIVDQDLRLARVEPTITSLAVRQINESIPLIRSTLLTPINNIDDVNSVIGNVNQIVNASFQNVYNETREPLIQYAEVDNVLLSRSIAALGISTVALNPNQLSAIVDNVLIEGASYRTHLSRNAFSLRNNIADVVRSNYAARTVNQIWNDIRTSALFESVENKINTLINTTTASMKNTSRLVKYRLSNIDRVMQVSVLDSKTSLICKAYAGKVWLLDGNYTPHGHNLPFENGTPRHFNCRSSIVPVTNMSIVKNYTFEEWFDSKSESEQDELLGPGRSQLWGSGRITTRDLVDQRGRPLTIAEIKKIHKID